MDPIASLLAKSAANHRNLCPRQVVGVRIGILAEKVLDLNLPQVDKRLFAFVKCDGCGMGGIMVASGCCVDRWTMRILDFGKLAATFVDTKTGKSIRSTHIRMPEQHQVIMFRMNSAVGKFSWKLIRSCQMRSSWSSNRSA